MIRSTARRVLRPLGRRRRARDKARGIRPDVALPFDMFDEVRTARDTYAAGKLSGIYHKGQRKVWNGQEVLAELLERHGGIDLDATERKALQGLFAVILWGELAAWKISADLAVNLEPLEAKMAATSQAHDEARHFYVMHDYLELLGDVPAGVGPRTQAVLEGTLRATTLTRKLMGMQMMIEPLALALFQMVRESKVEPVLCDLLRLYERDEARHVALGVLHLPKLMREMTVAEATALWTWEFGEFWKQIGMLHELEPHFAVLGIDSRTVADIARGKQIKANQMLMEELGAPIPVFEAFIRFFDMKLEWEFPTEGAGAVERFRASMRAWGRGLDNVPTRLSNVAA